MGDGCLAGAIFILASAFHSHGVLEEELPCKDIHRDRGTPLRIVLKSASDTSRMRKFNADV